jgi:DNA processing protein
VSRRRIERGAPGWPEGLEHLDRPPAGLWVEGDGQLRSGVAVVGSRRATTTGAEVAREIGARCAELGISVISGFAVGIDAAAHLGALDAGGETIAVLGCGLDVDYPRRHGELRRRVSASGLLISEHDLGVEPQPFHFPERNRIIAALATVVVVVEATERSGALSTARWAADLGRDLLAVPGSIHADQHRGANLLIRDGVRPYLDTTDLEETLDQLPVGSVPGLVVPARQLPPALQALVDRLGADPIHPDEAAAHLGLGAAEAGGLISALELVGEVVTLPGGLIMRRRRAHSGGLQ